MSYVIAGAGEGRPNGYPVIQCSDCSKCWHLPQSVRWDKAELEDCVAEAKHEGWDVQDHGASFCASCSKRRCYCG